MKIILSGGGEPQDVAAVDEYFAGVLDKDRPVLYIPIAMEADAFSYEECYDWFRGVYGGYGITKTELCTDFSSLRLDSRYSGVFIGGGNTFKLLAELQPSDFAGQLRDYLAQGGVLYGGSAGAIVCGATIEPAIHADENYMGLTDLSGLDLLGGYDVWCHYQEEQEAVTREYPRPLYILWEQSGLVFDGSAATPVGRPYLTRMG